MKTLASTAQSTDVQNDLTHETRRGFSLLTLLSDQNFQLLAIVLVQLALAIKYSTSVPMWLPSDERAHGDYFIDLLRNHSLHPYTIGDGRYEAYQPPLFYYICVAGYQMTSAVVGTNIQLGITLRLFCVAVGLATTLATYFVLKKDTYASQGLVMSTLACVAWNPSLLAITSSYSNDCALYLVSVLTVLLFAQFGFALKTLRDAVLLGAALGTGLLCKTTFVPIIGAIIVVCLYRDFTWPAVKRVAVMLATTALFVGPWLAWNWSHYHALTAAWLHIREYYHGDANGNPVKGLLSLITYHFLPCEFWYNQFKVPLLLKPVLPLLVSAGVIAAIVQAAHYLRHRGGATTLSEFSAIYYCTEMCTWGLVGLTAIMLPARDFFGGYFAFALFLNLVVSRTIAMWGKSWRAGVLPYATLPAMVLTLNVWLLTYKVGSLIDYGVHPWLLK